MKKLSYLFLVSTVFLASLIWAQEKNQAEGEKQKTEIKDEDKEKERSGKEEKQEAVKMDVVVSASRYEKPTSEIAKTVLVSKKKELETRGDKTLSEVITQTPGILFTRTGGYGGETGIYIRGGKTEQVLIMVDGIEANDPMGIGRGAQAELLPVSGVQRVEVLQGPASTLYGSDAEAGVINLISGRPYGGPGARFRLEAGSFESYLEQAEFYLGKSDYFADFTVSNFSTRGISSASEELDNDERDGYDNLSFSLLGGGKPASWLELEAVGKAIYAKTELDTVNLLSGLPEDDPNYKVNSTIYLSRVTAHITSGDFKQKLEFQYTNHLREYEDKTDELHPNTEMEGDYKSDLSKGVWQGEYSPMPGHKLVFGAEYQEESGESEVKGASDWGEYEDMFPRENLITRSGFILWDYHQTSYGFLGGMRADQNDQFGAHSTWELSGYFQPFEIGPRLRASYGTGFKAPSLFQLYGMVGGFQVGNPELEPEKSEGWEIGLDQELFDKKLKLSGTYFEAEYKDMIVWDNLLYQYNNIEKAQAPGWEVGFQAKPIPSLKLNFSYTFVDARDAETDEKLIRRWGEKYSFGLSWEPLKQLAINIWGIHRGETEDEIFEMFQEKRVELEPYTVLNASVDWQAMKDLQVNFRAENIFDEDYYEVYGYGTIPQSFYLGVSYNLEAKAGK